MCDPTADALTLAHRIRRADYVQYGKDDRGDGQSEEDVEQLEWEEQTEGEYHTADRARCPDGGIMRIIAMPHQRETVRGELRAEVQCQESHRPHDHLQQGPEEIQRDHVEGQVRQSGVNKASADQAVVLLAFDDLARLEGQAVEQRRIEKQRIRAHQNVQDEQ